MFNVELGHYLTYHHVTQNFFRNHRDKFDGLIIPLSVAIAFRQGTGGFVLTLRKQYALDPRTPIFQAAFERQSIRQVHLGMAAVHGPTVQAIFASRPLVPSDLDGPTVVNMAQRVVTFQKEFAQQSANKVAKYAELLGEDVQSSYEGPTFLVPPYFRYGSRSDPWYAVSLRLAEAAAREKGSYRLAPVVHMTQDFPDGELEPLLRDYSDAAFDGLVLFVNDLQEYVSPRPVLEKYARLVTTLRQSNRPLFGLFGGYFTLLLRKIGLGCFSNAVGYGEYRDSGYHEGGRAVRRYYVPRLHRYFTDIEARALLNIVNEAWVRCECHVCRRRLDITNLTSQELLDHFLNVRLQELHEASSADLGTMLDELEGTWRRLRRFRALPTDRYQHLCEWAAALRSF